MEVNVKPNDLEILWLPPQSDTDERVPTADEMATGTRLGTQHVQTTRAALKPAGVLNRPTFTSTNKNVVIPAGLEFFSPAHPTLSAIPINHTLTLPALADTVVSVSRYDRIYLCGFSAIVTDEIDPHIRLTFTWRNQSDILQEVTKENTRRVRDFYAFVWAAGETTPSTVLSELDVEGVKQLTVSKAAAGQALTTLRIYPFDANLADTETYVLIEDSLELIELLRVWRVQNTNQEGYFWGRSGEDDFEPDFHLQPSYRYVGEGWQDIQNRATESFWRLMRGESLSDTPTLDRSVQNLVNGQVGINLEAPGVATASPNGSTALANEQRVRFTNEAISQTLFCLPVVTTNSSGNAVATVNFAGNSPAGSAFASSGHKIYDEAGNDISSEGTFTGQGGTGALTWTASGGASISPSDTAYLVPAIDYPAGSGFPVAGDIEAVYFNAIALAAGNVRELSVNAPANYENPDNAEDFIVVLDKGRAALAHILKKVTVTASASGVVTIPSTARGLIAFIDGPSAPPGLQNVPVVDGLTNGGTYNLLVYHAPPGSEQWQFQFKSPRYAGTQESIWLNGARVATQPLAIAHSQIGGNSLSFSDAAIQHEVIGFRLPLNSAAAAVKGFIFNSTIQVEGEPALADIAFKEIDLPPGGYGHTQLKPGQILAVQNAIEAQSQGMAVSLQADDGLFLGTAKPRLDAATGYQLVIACAVEKNGDYRLLVITLNAGFVGLFNYLSYSSDADDYSGIDTFNLY